MKIALCLSGKYNNTNRVGDPTNFAAPAEAFKQNVIKPNEADVFIHGWDDDPELTKKMLDIYRPKDFKVEKQIEFDHPHKDHNFVPSGPYNTKDYIDRNYSRCYSFKKAVELVDDTYDLIMWNRFDTVFYKKQDLKALDVNFFYAANGRPHGPSSTIYNRGGFVDAYFIAGREDMKKYSLLYDRLDDYFNLENEGRNNGYYKHLQKHNDGVGTLPSMHKISRYRCIELGLEKNLRFFGREGETYDLLRFASQKKKGLN